MRTAFLYLLGVWWLGAGTLCAQSLPAANPPVNQLPPSATAAAMTAQASPAPANGSAAPATTLPQPPDASAGSASGSASSPTLSSASDAKGTAPCHGWAGVDYLYWTVKRSPLPVPILTTGDPRVGFDPNGVNTVNTAGAIGQPGTRVLIGDSVHWPGINGLRLTVGAWVEPTETFGVDLSGFVLERVTKRFLDASDATGVPPLYVPIAAGVPSTEMTIPIADPLRGFSGVAGMVATLQLWGVESNGILTLLRGPNVEWTALAGFRYADLRENLQIYDTTTDLIFNNTIGVNDTFRTKNQFAGGQIGSKLGFRYGKLSLDLVGKIALGSTSQSVTVLGNITQFGPSPLVPPGLGTFPGGIFAQPSNIGYRTADHFTYLPFLGVNVGCCLTQRCRLLAGYNFLYWSSVVRPGNQMDHNVNLTQNAVLDPNGVGKLVGPAVPAPMFNRSDFWAQGMNVGLEFLF